MKKADICSVFILSFVLSTIVAIVLAESFEQTISIPAGATRSIALQLSWGDTVKGVVSRKYHFGFGNSDRPDLF